MLIRLGHSPDPDDAFMFWALAADRIETRGFEFEHVLRDIQTLNDWALEGRLETTAISLHAYPFVQRHYAVLPHGASMGSGYGPVVVAREPLEREQLQSLEIAIPGRMTTAFLVLRLFLGDFRFCEVQFDRILDEVKSGRADAGLLIHEGQLTYEAEGLHKVVDLGEWWLLELYLAETLGLDVDNVHAEADRLEHVISEELEARIDKALGFPTHDPHGDPIPNAALEWPTKKAG